MAPTLGDKDLLIRPFRPRDQDVVRRLILNGLEERWGRLDQSRNGDLEEIATTYSSGVTLTGWLGDRLVGTATLAPRGDDIAEVVRMSTAVNCRRRGIATRLLTALLLEARRCGIKVVALETSAAWTDARALYERSGFRLEREEVGEPGGDAFYRLDLGDQQ